MSVIIIKTQTDTEANKNSTKIKHFQTIKIKLK